MFYQHTKTPIRHKILSSSGLAFLTMLVWEGVESLLEYAIAYFISSAITLLAVKLLTTFIIVTLTQSMIRQIQKFLMTFISKLTYKKGEDKVEKLKSIWELIKSNKCSIIVIICACLLYLSGTNIINVEDLPAIELGSEKVVEAVIQEEDLIATEEIYSEPVIATEDIYSEPVLADKLTVIAIQVIYEDDGSTIKYNIGDTVANSDFFKYSSQVAIYNVGDVIEPAKLLHKAGDVVEESKLLYSVGDVVVSKGTVLEEEKVIPPLNVTPYLYYLILGLGAGVAGVFFESPTTYKKRKEEAGLIKVAKKEIAQEKAKAIVEQKQKVADAEKAKCDEEKRLKIEHYKAEYRQKNN